MMSRSKELDIGKEFTRYPAGRYRADGRFSGERFRDDILLPALQEYDRVILHLDSVIGYSSSFLEEVFAGLIREHHFAPDKLLETLELDTRDTSLRREIQNYITSTIH